MGTLRGPHLVSQDPISEVARGKGSDGNRVVRNTVSGHTWDLSNTNGTGNCWTMNAYATSRGPITC